MGAINTLSNQKVFRSTKELPSSQIAYYLTEFLSAAIEQEGVLERASYKYVYLTKGDFKYFVQVTKDALCGESASLLKSVANNSEEDAFDILVSIDCVLYGFQGILVDMRRIKQMESQEEKIYNMMIENKNMELRRRENAHKRAECNTQAGIATTPAPVAKKQPAKVERSSQPVLIIIKEKIKATIDTENYIKESYINGELNMVIYDPKYQGLQLQLRNIKGAVKPSPYLDKQALKKGLLRFESERGCNKNIPLMKWAGKAAHLPFSIEYWNDEEDGKYLSIIGCTANQDLENLVLRFSKDEVSELQLEEGVSDEGNEIVWRIGSIKKDKSRTTELRFFGFSSKSIFPIDASFSGKSVESPLSVEKVLVNGAAVDSYEIRTVLEADTFRIVAE